MKIRQENRNWMLLVFLATNVSFAIGYIPTSTFWIPTRTTRLSSLSFEDVVAKASVATTAAAIAGTGFAKLVLDNPSRPYKKGSVGEEYDAWTSQGIVEYYWGEHIHLGYFHVDDKTRGQLSISDAQVLLMEQLCRFGEARGNPLVMNPKILDVGCGFGGTTRFLARQFGSGADVTGVSLSKEQVQRASEISSEQGVTNTKFVVEDAMELTSFEDNSHDLVWACESGEHMPDKKRYVEEMVRVLKPGGRLIIATWCQRDDSRVPFDTRDRRDLDYLYSEWSHPYFVSKERYSDLLKGTGVMKDIKLENWAKETLPTWRKTLQLAFLKPWGWLFKPTTYMRCLRDAYCMERMHRAFHRGLMEYGVLCATKDTSFLKK
eukprot:Nitzschia sp. Nitz4//scaffold22_size323478//178513//179723//NITZ4_000546-RA/size323478-augustus-gene-0.202-mRNA-1//1//CDS//3329543052//7543//frame0